MIKLLLVDDHTAFREALALICSIEEDISVISQAGSIAEARKYLQSVNLVLLDLGLPDGNGVDFVREIKSSNPACHVLVLTGSMNKLDLARAIDPGADGVMLKLSRVQDIIQAIRCISAGGSIHSPQEIAELLLLAGRARIEDANARDKIGQLTDREREILQAIAEGLSDKEIAARFNITVDTAHKHANNILRKLDTNSRLQAVLFALRHGAISL